MVDMTDGTNVNMGLLSLEFATGGADNEGAAAGSGSDDGGRSSGGGEVRQEGRGKVSSKIGGCGR